MENADFLYLGYDAPGKPEIPISEKKRFCSEIGISDFPGGSYPKYKKPAFSALQFPPDS